MKRKRKVRVPAKQKDVPAPENEPAPENQPAPEDEPAPEEDQVIHQRICDSLVKIICYEHNSNGTREIRSVITGVIIASGNRFCHVIGLWTAVLRSNSAGWFFEVQFPDGRTTALQRPVEGVNLRRELLTLTLEIPKRINPVHIGADTVSPNQQVFAVGFAFDEQEHLPGVQVVSSYRSRGFVTHQRDDFFSHDCPPRAETYQGGPIFNEQEEFVGLTFKNRGVADAFSITALTQQLASHTGIMGKTLSEILQCIIDKVEPPMKKKADGGIKIKKKQKFK